MYVCSMFIPSMLCSLQALCDFNLHCDCFKFKVICRICFVCVNSFPWWALQSFHTTASFRLILFFIWFAFNFWSVVKWFYSEFIAVHYPNSISLVEFVPSPITFYALPWLRFEAKWIKESPHRRYVTNFSCKT